MSDWQNYDLLSWPNPCAKVFINCPICIMLNIIEWIVFRKTFPRKYPKWWSKRWANANVNVMPGTLQTDFQTYTSFYCMHVPSSQVSAFVSWSLHSPLPKEPKHIKWRFSFHLHRRKHCKPLTSAFELADVFCVQVYVQVCYLSMVWGNCWKTICAPPKMIERYGPHQKWSSRQKVFINIAFTICM